MSIFVKCFGRLSTGITVIALGNKSRALPAWLVSYWQTLALRWAFVHIYGILSGCIYRVGKTCPLWVASFSGILYCRQRELSEICVAVHFSTVNEILATASKSCWQLDSTAGTAMEWTAPEAMSIWSPFIRARGKEAKTLLPNCIPSPTTARTLKLQCIARGERLQSGIYVCMLGFSPSLYYSSVLYVT